RPRGSIPRRPTLGPPADLVRKAGRQVRLGARGAFARSTGVIRSAGERARDTFLGLPKTCAELAVSFRDHLGARPEIPDAAAVPGRPASSGDGRRHGPGRAATVGPARGFRPSPGRSAPDPL